jgi:hypothetical protein
MIRSTKTDKDTGDKMQSNHTFKGRVRAISWAAALACAIVPFAANASAYQPAGIDLGATTFNDAFGGMDPGWTTIQLLQYEHNTKFYDNNGNNPGTFKNGDLNALIWLPQIIYTSPFHLMGGALGFTALLPVTDLNASSDPAGPGGADLTSRSGIGDITFGPFLQFAPIISGGRPVFVHRFEFDVIAPTGAYDPTKLVNPGSNFWSLNPYYAFTWLPTPKTSISVRMHYLYNFTNNNPGDNFSDGYFPGMTKFKAGQAVWANFGIAYKVLPNLDVGLNGFWFRQITDDTVNGVSQSADRTTNVSLGPGAEWTIDRRNYVFVNIYLPVVERNTYSGFHMNLRWIHSF